MKALVIGLDGLDRNMVNEYCDGILSEGHMAPNYVSRFKNTIVSWPSIYTGLQGAGFPHSWQKWIRDINNQPHIRDKYTIWNEAERRGMKVGLFGMPVTYPPGKINGWWVAGYPAIPDNEKLIYPKTYVDLLEDYVYELDELVNMRLIERHGKQLYDTEFPLVWQEAYKEFLDEHIRTKMLTLGALYDRCPVDVLFVGWMLVDHWSHKRLDMRVIYERVEKIVYALREAFQPENIIVISDHGANHEHHTPEGVCMHFGRDPPERQIYEWHLYNEILRVIV